MTLRQALILGLLQGLTEFLPVSSSGHLVMAQKLLALEKPPVLFDILVHLGTFLSILLFLNRKIFLFFKKISNLKLIFVSSLPAAILGFFLNDYLESVFNSLLIVGLCLFINSLLLFSSGLIKKMGKNLSQLKLKEGFKIGLFQALALLPGISRSGSTIVAGLGQGLTRQAAFLFSFFLGLPAMLGALLLQMPKISQNSDQLAMGLVGLLVAAFSGLLALKILYRIVTKGRLLYFGFYCLLLSVGLISLISF